MRRKVQVWILSRDSRAPEGLKVLLLRTHEGRGQFWQPVTGKVEDGESFDAAAAREAHEETGFELDTPPHDTGYEFEFEVKTKKYTGKAQERVYWVELKGCPPPTLDPNEHDACAWVDLKTARERVKFESNQIALNRVCAQVQACEN